MVKNVLIVAANGQISRIIEARLLNEAAFSDVHLTLLLRNPKRLASLADNARVTLIEGSLDAESDLKSAVAGQDIVFVGVVDHTADNHQTQSIVDAMQAAGVNRLIYTNVLGIYDEVPGAFGAWNKQTIGSGLQSARQSDQIMAESGLNYTTLRLPWLNDRGIKYEITHKNEPYLGVSGSRKSVADVVLRMIADPSFLANDSVGIADADTQGQSRPVY